MKKISIILIVFLIGCTKNTTINNNITPATKPVLTTNPINNISNTMAFSGGTFITDGESNILSKGVCWSTNHNPTINDFKSDDGTGVTNYSSVLTGLSRNTTYYVKAFATNSVGIGYGNEVSFTTTDSSVIPIGNLPTVIINSINSITTNNAIAYGNVTNQGSSSVTAKGFKYFTTPNYGGGWQTVSVGTGLGTFSKTINSLQPNTTYYISAYATNSFGTAFSNEISFTTSNTSATVTDIDGNVYNTVTIGSQVWMVENLKVSKYRDGTSIPNVTDNTQWLNLTTGAYCYLNNDAGYNDVYGKLYNWYSVNDARGLAPTGWHIPSYSEIQTLANYLGGTWVDSSQIYLNIGGKLKSTSSLWNYPNVGADNSSGFSALPSAFRSETDGFYLLLGSNASFWTSSQFASDKASDYSLPRGSTNFGLHNFWNKKAGLAIRCIKD